MIRRLGSAGMDTPPMLRSGCTDARVKNRVERLTRLFVTKHEVPDLLAVEATFAVENRFAERLDDRRETGRAGLDDLTCEIIRVDHRDTELREHLGDGGLSARDPTRQTYNRFHRRRVLVIALPGQDDLPCASAVPCAPSSNG